MVKEELIAALKELGVVYKKPIKTKHAGVSDYYFDIKKAYGYFEVMDIITNGIINLFPEGINCVAGEGYGGVPLATALSQGYELNLILVRDKPKDHGIAKWIDGYTPTPADKVAIVDDVFNTGKTLDDIINIIRPTKAEIVGCYVVVKREKGKLSVPVHYLLTAKDLL